MFNKNSELCCIEPVRLLDKSTFYFKPKLTLSVDFVLHIDVNEGNIKQWLNHDSNLGKSTDIIRFYLYNSSVREFKTTWRQELRCSVSIKMLLEDGEADLLQTWPYLMDDVCQFFSQSSLRNNTARICLFVV